MQNESLLFELLIGEKLNAGIPHEPGAATTTTFGDVPAITPSDIIRAIKHAYESLPAEPFAQHMIDRGCPPSEGWVMLLPSPQFAQAEAESGSSLPHYVKPSPLAQTPMLIRWPKVSFTRG